LAFAGLLERDKMESEKSHQHSQISKTDIKYYDRQGYWTTQELAVRQVSINYDDDGNYLGGGMIYSPSGFPVEHE